MAPPAAESLTQVEAALRQVADQMVADNRSPRKSAILQKLAGAIASSMNHEDEGPDYAHLIKEKGLQLLEYEKERLMGEEQNMPSSPLTGYIRSISPPLLDAVAARITDGWETQIDSAAFSPVNKKGWGSQVFKPQGAKQLSLDEKLELELAVLQIAKQQVLDENNLETTQTRGDIVGSKTELTHSVEIRLVALLKSFDDTIQELLGQAFSHPHLSGGYVEMLQREKAKLEAEWLTLRGKPPAMTEAEKAEAVAAYSESMAALEAIHREARAKKLCGLHVKDRVTALEETEGGHTEQVLMLRLFSPEYLTTTLEALSNKARTLVMAELSTEDRAHIEEGKQKMANLEKMSAQERFDTLVEMGPEEQFTLLHNLKPEERASSLLLMSPADKAAIYNALSEKDRLETEAAEELEEELVSMSPMERAWALKAMSPTKRRTMLHNMPPEARASALAELPPEESYAMLALMPEMDRATTLQADAVEVSLESMPAEERARAMSGMEPEELMKRLHNMPPEYRAAALDAMHPSRREALLDFMTAKDRAETLKADEIEDALEAMTPEGRVAAFAEMPSKERNRLLRNLALEHRASTLAAMPPLEVEKERYYAEMPEPDRSATVEVEKRLADLLAMRPKERGLALSALEP